MKQFKALLPFLLVGMMILPCAAADTAYYKGIDVSVYQGDITFSDVLDAGYEAVYIRAGEGSDMTDSYFEDNYQKASEAGLDYGFYYYVTATSESEAKTQAERFASLISGTGYTMRPAMDFESLSDLSDDEANEIAAAFLSTLATETGVTPAIYSDASNVESVWDSSLADYPLWVAAYEDLSTPEDYTLPDNDVWSSWSGYQYTDSLSVDGISGDVDGDIFTDALFISDTDSTNSDSTSSDSTSTDSTSSDSSTTDGTTTDSTSSDSTTTTTTATTGSSYTVQSGDTLWKIARLYSTTVDALASYNGIEDPDYIYIGDVIKIPSTSTSSYTIQSGDTLWQIALTYGTTVSELASLNSITQIHLIYVGDVLLIPVG